MAQDTGFDRRSLLAGAGAAVAATAFGATPALAEDPHRRKRGRGHGHGHGGRGSIPREQISIQLYTVRDADPFETTLKGLADLGYKTVEHAGFEGLSAADFRALLRKYGVRATSGHQALPQPFDEAAWRAQVADAVTVGQRYIVTPLSPITYFPPDGNPAGIKGLTTVAAWKASPPTATRPARSRASPGCGSASRTTSGSSRGSRTPRR